MFTNRAFKSWSLIVVGAMIFASLFMLVAMMANLVFDGIFRATPSTLSFGLVAFAGYVGVALVLRGDAARSMRR